MDPSCKKNTVPCTIEDKGNSSYHCTYNPTQEGQHVIYVTFAGGQISRSPFTVNVGEGTRICLSPLPRPSDRMELSTFVACTVKFCYLSISCSYKLPLPQLLNFNSTTFL